VLDRLRAVDALDDDVGLLPCAVHVALAHPPVVVGAEVRIGGAPLVERRRVGIRGDPDVEDGLALLVVHPDGGGGGEGGLLGLRRDGRDDLALPAHLVLGEQRLVGRHAERLQVPVDVLRDVPVRDDRVDAGIASAALVSMERICAWWCGERTALVHSVPWTRTSSTYWVRPVTWARPS
jgi:hypothetical protein